VLNSLFPNERVIKLDLDDEKDCTSFISDKFDIVYCYGLLYHLGNPAGAIKFMSNHCKLMLLVETCVSIEPDSKLINVKENKNNPTQSLGGNGCLPTRAWIFNELKHYFDYVYLPKTQPAHPEFPLDWKEKKSNSSITRAVFIASRNELRNTHLLNYIPEKQSI